MPKPKTKRKTAKRSRKPATVPAIQVRGARQNNLKGLDLDIPLGKLNVITGPSGSGKSSLAFQTLYAEGQRRYVETFSPYTRQFFDRMDKPQVEAIHGIPPAIAIEQSNNVKTTRSTVGTITEINDYLKLFFPRICRGYDPESGAEISPDTPQSILRKAREHFGKTAALLVTFGIAVPADSDIAEFFEFLQAQGYLRILVFGEIYRTDAPDQYDRPKLPALVDVIQDRVAANRTARFQEAVERALDLGHNRVALVDANDPANRAAYSRGWASAVTDTELRAPTPALFSFNNPLGACPECRGFGRVIGIDLDRALPDRTLTIADGVVRPFAGEKHAECQEDLERNCALRDVDIHTPFLDLPEEQQEWVLEGEYPGNAERAWEENEWYGVRGFFTWLESRAYKMHVRVMLSRYRNYTTCGKCRGSRLQPQALHFKIVTPDKARKADPKLAEKLTLPALWKLPVDRLLPLIDSLEAELAPGDDAAALLHGEIRSRLNYLDRVGLSYLDLDRPTRTLSGGETERVNLTTCLGAALTNTLFVLDEPTVGLHPRDIHRLVEVMTDLRDRGNTLAVVEHEEAVIRAADHLIDIGPGRGEHGGHLTFEGPLPSGGRSSEVGVRSRPDNKILGRALRPPPVDDQNVGRVSNPSPEHPYKEGPRFRGPTVDDQSPSLTLAYLSGQKTIPIPLTRRQPDPKRVLKIRAASANNLRGIDVTLPLARFVCITGVSGSGKSTLIHDVLYRNLMAGRGQATGDSHSGSEPGACRGITGDTDAPGNIGDIVMVDQSPLSRTPRSTPAVYTGVFDDIRKLFADSPDGKARGVTPGYFSFNSGDGRCERCWGTGYEKVEMQFLSDLFVTCPECEGTRYTPEAMEIELGDKNIHQMLRSTISESIEFFFALDTGNKLPTRIVTSLQILADVGLGYLRLGQPLNTLSGGEAQRLKLVSHLLAQRKSKSETANDLLIFDEPTTGLHFDDVAVLLKVFDRLVEAGNSLLVIEHNLEVIKSADHLIDLGPEAGRHGGQIVATGTPEEVARIKTSHTGQHLKTVLGTKRQKASATTQLARVAEKSAQYSPSGRVTPSPPHQVTPSSNSIEIRGAREHNLKNIDLQVPRDKFVVVTGLSGSGKSTLAFDILFAEGQRRFLDSMSAYARQFVEQLERPDIDLVAGLPPTVAIEQRISRGGGKSTVATVTEVWHFVRLLYAKTGVQHSPDTGKALVRQSLTAIVTRLRNEAKKTRGKNGKITLMAPLIKARKGYHTEVAAWAERQGFDTLFVDRQFKAVKGFQRLERFKEHSIDVVVLEITKATKPAAIRTAVELALKIGKRSARYLDGKNRAHHLSTELSDPDTGRSFEELDPRLFSYNSPHGWCPGCRGYGRIETRPASDDPHAESQLDAELREERRRSRSRSRSRSETIPCPVCNGARLNEIALAVRVANQPIDAIAALSVVAARQHFDTLKFTGTNAAIARDILPEIRQRLQFMEEVGLGYLQLDRSATTLSGGESQRIRLAAQLGSNLRGVLYILDEPTIGLHPRDNAALLDTLEELRKKGNSLLVVEHDDDTVRRADHVIDLGPGAGLFGGEVVLQASLKNKSTLTRKFRAAHPDSPTLEALAEPMPHPLRGERRPLPGPRARKGWLKIVGARANNLKNLDVQLPLGRLTVITGISGSGKSSFMRGVLEPAIEALFTERKRTRDKTLGALAGNKLPDSVPAKSLSGAADIAAMYEVDQSPIGKTSRSTPATYVKVFDEIRKLFAQLPEARARGYTASRFSFNTEGGRCEACKGNGQIKLEMNFLPTSYVECEDCHGQRYNPPTLEIEYKGKNIGEIMDLTIDEAAEFFSAYSKIHRTLSLMRDTGLGYLRLGQPSPTVSGGEAQRIKLVTELTRGIGRSENARVRKNLSLKSAGTNLYLIEEPSIGLHMQDVRKLLEVLHRLVDDGHTVVVIEHNLDIIAEADYVVDIGPEAGPEGGEIVVEGTPEEVAACAGSRTAVFLR